MIESKNNTLSASSTNQYLVVNSEFLNQTELSGFQINSISNGTVNLSVIFNISFLFKIVVIYLSGNEHKIQKSHILSDLFPALYL